MHLAAPADSENSLQIPNLYILITDAAVWIAESGKLIALGKSFPQGCFI